MVLRFRLDADDLLHSRFAVSPLFEFAGLVRTLSAGSSRAAPWARRLVPEFNRLRADDDAFAAILALNSRHYGPAFTSPPPTGMAQSVDDDLAAVRSTSLTQARREIRDCLARRPTAEKRVLAVLRSPAVVDRFADALDRA